MVHSNRLLVGSFRRQGVGGTEVTGVPRHRLPTGWVALGLILSAAAGCGDGGVTDPSALRFGQIGEVRFQLRVPLQVDQGELIQELTWSSTGPWKLREAISYRGVMGDDHLIENRLNPDLLAGTYAGWITQVNDDDRIRLFTEGLDPNLDPDCGVNRTRMTLAIRDEARGRVLSWIRCTTGSLTSLTPTGAGPDPGASRVATAIALARDATVGSSTVFQSEYAASMPFATIEKNEDTLAELPLPRALTDQEGWLAFWRAHTGSQTATPPVVDFERDLVLVASVGLRHEAGDSVEIRRVLPVDGFTYVELVERIPGDFCAPAERPHVPVHIVLAPVVPLPIEFVDLAVELVPCGG